MKYFLNLFVLITLSISLLGFYYDDQDEAITIQDETNQIDVPENVQAILDRSCLPCHGADGSGKAKMKWNYEKMPDYSKTKLISKLVKISEKVEADKMPPPKNVKKNPDRKLSDDDKKVLTEWAEGAAEKSAGWSEE